jgi:hypothetical protein
MKLPRIRNRWMEHLLIDEAFDAYLLWRDESAEVWHAAPTRPIPKTTARAAMRCGSCRKRSRSTDPGIRRTQVGRGRSGHGGVEYDVLGFGFDEISPEDRQPHSPSTRGSTGGSRPPPERERSRMAIRRSRTVFDAPVLDRRFGSVAEHRTTNASLARRRRGARRRGASAPIVRGSLLALTPCPTSTGLASSGLAGEDGR